MWNITKQKSKAINSLGLIHKEVPFLKNIIWRIKWVLLPIPSDLNLMAFKIYWQNFFVEQKKCLWNGFFQVTFFFKSLKLAFWVWTVIEKWNLPCHSPEHHSRVLCLNSSLHFSHDLQWYVPKLIYSYFVTNYLGKWWWWHLCYMLEMSYTCISIYVVVNCGNICWIYISYIIYIS